MSAIQGLLFIEVNGMAVGTFRIVRYIVGVRYSGVSVKQGSTVDTKLHRGTAQKGGSEKPPNVIPDMHPNFKTFSGGACPYKLLGGWLLSGQLDVFHIFCLHKTNFPPPKQHF